MKGSTRISNSIQIGMGEPFKSNPMTAEKTVKKEYRENLALLKAILESSRAEMSSEGTLLASNRRQPDLK
jgi:hypothetical protein